MSTDLAATRAFGRAQDSGHETTLVVEHLNRLEAVFIVMRVEQLQLLLPVKQNIYKSVRDKIIAYLEQGELT